MQKSRDPNSQNGPDAASRRYRATRSRFPVRVSDQEDEWHPRSTRAILPESTRCGSSSCWPSSPAYAVAVAAAVVVAAQARIVPYSSARARNRAISHPPKKSNERSRGKNAVRPPQHSLLSCSETGLALALHRTSSGWLDRRPLPAVVGVAERIWGLSNENKNGRWWCRVSGRGYVARNRTAGSPTSVWLPPAR